MDSRAVLARLDTERQALAMMDHTNIAQAFDAGATEFVDGLPVTGYCERKGLSLRERISLFIPVCHTIQHAHQKEINYRDINPSFVLVRKVGGKAIPKVIDFGLAKALGVSLSDDTLITR